VKFRNSAESDFWQRAYLVALETIGATLFVDWRSRLAEEGPLR